ncbi:hypothetical protein LTR22_016168 [Elasticomyces elasticus]|nr:hypothetical protein LTR22_016168 [Elasticomyces elasticus]KAK4914429.1 hypothetical protein LTR49_017349 [Elasticomyces elasticus]KAK5760405.1 hypothetical protein LTS12_009449 [Elasticomyces elasticus]
MGQNGSRPERAAEAGRENRRSMILQSIRHSTTVEEDGLLRNEQSGGRSRQQRPRSASANRLSQLLRPASRVEIEAASEADTTRRSGLQRTATRMRNLLARNDSTREPSGEPRPSLGMMQHRTSYVRAGMNRDGADYYPPRLPSIDVSSTFDHDTFAAADDLGLLARSSSSRRSNVVSTLNSLRAHRPSFRQFASSLRRPRSPQPSSRRSGNEDQAAMLSRLLSVAAAATAATLIGDDHQALSEARSLTNTAGMGDLGSGGEDGSFDGFLRALQNGRIASALRQGGGADTDTDSAPRESPLNFFRMFRFGASGAPTPLSTGLGDPSEASDGNGSEGRMVPIIIVGIRSINPNSTSGLNSATDELPPFIDALGNFPSPLPTTTLGAHGQDSIDSILRPPQNGTSFRHRRRASMGGFGMGRNRISDRLDDQRDHRSPDRRRERPWSVASSSSTYEPRPPPATPASPSPELSRISSRNSTPSHSRPASFVANSVRDFGGDSRRNSTLHRASAATPLSSHTEETSSLHSSHSGTNLLNDDGEPFRFHSHRRSDTAPNIHYPRFSSGHPRRNGVVEPDNLPSLSRSSTANATDANSTSNNMGSEGRSSSNDSRSNDSRSWIIYVLGGSYPENHPILTTPSLFTENPTYEDMMLLSALLGPAKAPVASEEDVQSAGGVYNVELITVGTTESNDAAKTAELVAVAAEGKDRVEIESGQRCLVCLCDFEEKEVCRKLVKCSHLFHKECIDQWLTQGRNSCPLCRGEGVNEQEKPTTPVPDGTPARPAELSAA